MECENYLALYPNGPDNEYVRTELIRLREWLATGRLSFRY